jgi:hypothetical protein
VNRVKTATGKRWAMGVLVCALAVAPGACSPAARTDEPAQRLDAGALSYEQAAARYNANARNLQRLWASAVIRLSFVDRDGQQRTEQGEGRLQIVQPDRVALSVGKLGETLFWIGCDAQRYWWLDLTGDQHIGYAGRHEYYERSRARAYGVVVPPLELIPLLGIAPLPERGGAAQVSGDGRLVGLTVAWGSGGGRRRVWVEPATGLPVQVELFDASGAAQLVCALEAHDTVQVSGLGDLPRMATRARVAHAESRSLITLDLSSMEDGASRVRPEAFALGPLLTQMRVELLYDLDLPARPARP